MVTDAQRRTAIDSAIAQANAGNTSGASATLATVGGSGAYASGSSKPADASFTSQGSTYNPATTASEQTKVTMTTIPAQNLNNSRQYSLQQQPSVTSPSGSNPFANQTASSGGNVLVVTEKEYQQLPQDKKQIATVVSSGSPTANKMDTYVGMVSSGQQPTALPSTLTKTEVGIKEDKSVQSSIGLTKEYSGLQVKEPQLSFKERWYQATEKFKYGDWVSNEGAIATLFSFKTNRDVPKYLTQGNIAGTKSTSMGYGMSEELKEVTYPSIYGKVRITEDYGQLISSGLLGVGTVVAPQVFAPVVAVSGMSNIYQGFTEPKLSDKLFKIGFGAVEFIGGTYIGVETLRSSITQMELDSAFKNIKFEAVGRTRVGEGYMDYYKGVQDLGYAQRITTAQVYSKPIEGSSNLFASAGKMSTTVKIYEIGTGKPILAQSSSMYGGKSFALPETQGVYPNINYGSSWKTSDMFIKGKYAGTSDLTKFDARFNLYENSLKVESFTAGISKRIGTNYIISKSGPITQIDFKQVRFGKGTYEGFKLTTETKNIAILKELPEDFPSTYFSKGIKITKPNVPTETTPSFDGGFTTSALTKTQTKIMTTKSFTPTTNDIATALTKTQGVTLQQTRTFATTFPSIQTESLTKSKPSTQMYAPYTIALPQTKNFISPIYGTQTFQTVATQRDLVTTLPQPRPQPQPQPQPQRLTMPVVFGGSSLGTPDIINPIRIPKIPIFDFKFPSFDEGGSRKKVNKGKRKYSYTPSYEAIILGLRGKKPKGRETGARIRPITKGFNWSKLFGNNKR
jgi:hypothetical protein